jgi:hypothetical protein
LGILIFKELTAQRLYKSFGVKGLNLCNGDMNTVVVQSGDVYPDAVFRSAQTFRCTVMKLNVLKGYDQNIFKNSVRGQRMCLKVCYKQGGKTLRQIKIC